MKSEYILVLDQGTTSSRAMLFDRDFQIKEMAQKEFPQIFPKSGWVEQNPSDLLQSSLQVLAEVIGKCSLGKSSEIIGMGIANQRETTIVWDRKTGEPIYNAIVWQDRRTAEYCNSLCNQDEMENIVSQKTGLLIDPYFSATKIKWILDHVKGSQALAEKGGLAFGTVDTFLLWHLTQGLVHCTDVTNASRTCLFNIHDLTWDELLLKKFGIPASILPEVQENHAEFGVAYIPVGKEEVKLPIFALVGDQQAASIGQGNFSKGDLKSTYGTGCFVLVNTEKKILQSSKKLLSTIAFQIKGEISYALEGSIFHAGTMIQWLRDELQILNSAEESEKLARATKGNEGIYFIPAFTGLGAPHWKPKARAALIGITRSCSRAQIVRACLEAAAYQTVDLLDAILVDASRQSEQLEIGTFAIDGGMARNSWMVQFLADVSGLKVRRPKQIESTSLGVAFLVALHVGRFASLAHVKKYINDSMSADFFYPAMDSEVQKNNLRGWKDAMACILNE